LRHQGLNIGDIIAKEEDVRLDIQLLAIKEILEQEENRKLADTKTTVEVKADSTRTRNNKGVQATLPI
jgi:hypothetical protein